jgi:hypothetical protein
MSAEHKKKKIAKAKKGKAAKSKKPKDPPPPNPPFQKVIPLSLDQMMVRGTVITIAPGPDPDLTLRHADILIPTLIDSPTVNLNLYSTHQSPAFALNNYIVTYNEENKETYIGADFSNTRTDKNGNPLPEPATNVFNCDYIMVGTGRK